MTDIAALFGVILISAVVMLIMREQSKTAASLVAIARFRLRLCIRGASGGRGL